MVGDECLVDEIDATLLAIAAWIVIPAVEVILETETRLTLSMNFPLFSRHARSSRQGDLRRNYQWASHDSSTRKHVFSSRYVFVKGGRTSWFVDKVSWIWVHSTSSERQWSLSLFAGFYIKYSRLISRKEKTTSTSWSVKMYIPIRKVRWLRSSGKKNNAASYMTLV